MTDIEKARSQSLKKRVVDAVGSIDDLNTAVQATMVVGAAATSDMGAAGFGLVGVLAGARFGKYAEAKQEKLAEAIHDTTERIEGLADRIDREFVRSEEFVGLAFRAHTTNLNSSRDEKIRYIRNFVINSSLEICSTDPDKEFYLHLIDVLTFRQLEYFIAFCSSLSAGDFRRFLREQQPNGHILSSVTDSLLGRGREELEAQRVTEELLIACRVLASYGVLRVVEKGPGQVSYHYETTPLTFRFARFIGDTEDVISSEL